MWMLHGKLLESIVSTTCFSFLCILQYHNTIIPLDRGIRVPEKDAEQSGLTADQVQINSKYGGGYPANVAGLHHLHCLVRLIIFM